MLTCRDCLREPIAGWVLELMKGEAQGCKDVACLTEASMVLCHLARLQAEVSRPALQALLVLLCNRFPKVLPLHTDSACPSTGGLSHHPCRIASADLEYGVCRLVSSGLQHVRSRAALRCTLPSRG